MYAVSAFSLSDSNATTRLKNTNNLISFDLLKAPFIFRLKGVIFLSIVETEYYNLLIVLKKNCIPLIIGKTRNRKQKKKKEKSCKVLQG